MSFIDPIIPEPDWGITSPNVNPAEWEEEEEGDDYEDADE
jgi:hypothetical protein